MEAFLSFFEGGGVFKRNERTEKQLENKYENSKQGIRRIFTWATNR